MERADDRGGNEDCVHLAVAGFVHAHRHAAHAQQTDRRQMREEVKTRQLYGGYRRVVKPLTILGSNVQPRRVDRTLFIEVSPPGESALVPIEDFLVTLDADLEDVGPIQQAFTN